MFGREPVRIAAAIRAIIFVGIAFGLKWTAEQVAYVMLAVEAVLMVVTREAVTAPATLRDAGTSKAEVALKAEVGRAQVQAQEMQKEEREKEEQEDE